MSEISSTVQAAAGATLLERVRAYGDSSARSRLAFRFLVSGTAHGEVDEMTWQELDRSARAVAARLVRSGAAGQRVLLLFQTGLDFVSAFFGCLYAGAVAVPVTPPDPSRLARSLPRMAAIVRDAQAQFILAAAEVRTLVEPVARLDGATWLDLNAVADEELADLKPSDRQDTAFLQYTSGSTGDPKGIVVTHANLTHNLTMMEAAWRLGAETSFVCWAPLFHDMGLVMNLLATAWLGATCTLMRPSDFARNPAEWLRAISRFRGTVSMAPNFAYDLTVARVPLAALAGLDLSSWRVAVNAAEPTRPDTMERFAQKLAPLGFSAEALQPAWGLAEATVLVTTRGIGRGPRTLTLCADALERGQVVLAAPGTGRTQRFASQGCPWHDMDLRIVDPEACQALGEQQLGEIWLCGPSVAKGYFRRPEQSQETFAARLLSSDEGPFLRTGDLGFLHDGELFLTGRRKDLLILRGRNLYPQDVERAIEESHPALRAGCCAAFSVDSGTEEQLIVAAEVETGRLHDSGEQGFGELARVAARAVLETCGVRLEELLLLEPRTIPKTSSGKIQRLACRQARREGRLELLHTWRSADAERDGELSPAPTGLAAVTVTAVADRIRAFVSRGHEATGGAAPDDDAAFHDLGVDSLRALELAAAIETWTGHRIDATAVWSCPTVMSLAAHVVALGSGPGAPAPSAQSVDSGSAQEPIAIVGIGCRFPGGASDPEAFWTLLDEGRDAISEVPCERWDVDAYHDPDPSALGKMTSRWGGFLSGLDRFEPGFFGISAREAPSIDPQARLLLETTWEAFERAGIDPAALVGSKTGVYLGLSQTEYQARALGGAIDAYTLLGTMHSTMAGRLSYWLGLQGPSVPIDTACSSSLVAVHLACQALCSGDCNLAIAGGANTVLEPETSIYFSRLRALSPTGRCRTFSADADGYVRAEGAGIIVLERLSDARRLGHTVLALVRGSAVNQDGRSNGLAAPSRPAQEAVIREAVRRAAVAPNSVGYLECHGAGTPLGDPIEVQAAAAVLCEGRDPAWPLVLGSVKTNIGHTESAAGIAGLIKTVLALGRGRIPRNLHLSRPNPHIRWETLPIRVASESIEWPRGATPRRAGVSAFGFGGTNAHVVLEEGAAAADRAVPAARPAELVVLSAKSRAALLDSVGRFREHLDAHPDMTLADLAASTALRPHLGHRLALAVESRIALRSVLHSVARGETPVGVACREAHAASRRGKLAFLFTGQGAHTADMGRQLHAAWPVFRDALDAALAALDPDLERPLRDVMWPSPADAGLLDQPGWSQPALFALEWALAAQWRSFGVAPDLVAGQSVGEIAAACVAGVFPLEDAARLVTAWSRLTEALPAGGATLSCATESLARVAASVRYQAPSLGIVSSFTGALAGTEIATPAYWMRLARDDVRFSASARALQAAGAKTFIEIGPRPTLLELVRAGLQAPGVLLGSLGTGRPEPEALLQALGSWYAMGGQVDWRGVVAPGARRVALPTTAWQRERYWIEPRPRTSTTVAAADDPRPLHVLRISGPSTEALQEAAARLGARLRDRPQDGLCDVVASCSTSAPDEPHRLCVITADAAAAARSLDAHAAGLFAEGVFVGEARTHPRVAFLFAGQGAQVAGMGRRLHETEPAFRAAFDEAVAELDRHLEHPLREIMWAAAGTPRAALLDRTGTTQPALFAFEWALVALWRTRGICPDVVLGHSLGELVAACVADVVGLADCCRLVVARARAMEALPPGGEMIAIAASEAVVLDALAPLRERVAVAAVNGPEAVVISGPAADARAVAAWFAARGVRTKRLAISLAAHSPLVDPMLEGLTELATTLALRPPRLALISNVTGARAGAALMMDPAYWARQVRSSVRFAEGLIALDQVGAEICVEIGPQSVLLGMDALARPDAPVVRVASLTRGRDEHASALEAMARLHVAGAPVDWSTIEGRAAHPSTQLGRRPPATAGNLEAIVRTELARILALPSPADVPLEAPFQELGLDSLMAVELRSALIERLGTSLPATIAFDYPSLGALCDHLLTRVEGQDSTVSAPGRSRRAATDEPVAIVGIGCRFPGGVQGPDALWRLLEDGVDAITEVPSDRWAIDDWYDPDPSAAGKMSSRWGGFVELPDRFDAAFFGIAPREAVAIDPQQRLLLECTWEALERSGIVPGSLMGSNTGVYVGISANDYQYWAMGDPGRIDGYSYLGTAHSATVGRLSYWLGLKGPNLPIDTACSSALVAIHLACQGLRLRECDLALSGGVNLTLAPECTVYFSRLRALSPTGRCRSFSAGADGYVRAEGCGVLVLKRLSDALRDGDPVVAVIRGSAVNQDGRSNGFTAPNGPSQQDVIVRALANAGLAPAEVGYVECHGTGTSLGDPIEVQAIGAAIGAGRPADRPVVIGSVKSNVGHTEGAAGVAGLIKAALCVQRGRIPATLHAEALNPMIAWDQWPVAVARQAMPFPDGPRVAGVSSFGFSGTNAHVVLSAAPETPVTAATTRRPAELVVLSGRDETSLAEATTRLAAHLDAHPELALGDLARTLATSRTSFACRLAITASSLDALRHTLIAVGGGQTPDGVARGTAGNAPSLALWFPGGGGDLERTAQELGETWPVFRQALAAAIGALARASREDATDERPAERVAFAAGVALGALWRSWGIVPNRLGGAGVGEIVAAQIGGVLSLAEAARLVVASAQPDGHRIKDPRVHRALEIPAVVPGALGASGPEVVLDLEALRADVPASVAMLEVLGALHARGAEVDWRGVFPVGGPVVDLPTYPWQRQRYWLGKARAAIAAGDQNLVSEDGPTGPFYELAWQRQASVPPVRRARGAGRFRVMATAGDGSLLASALRQAGAETELITPGEVTQDASGATALVLLLEQSPIASGVLLGMTTTAITARIPLWLVTRGAVSIGAGDVPSNPEQAVAWGLGRTLALEEPSAWGGLVDLPGPLDVALARQLGQVLIARAVDDQLALRAGGAWVPRVVPAAVPGAARGFRTTGAALVTGGLGALGRRIAGWLAERGAQHLLLVGRRGLQTPGAAATVAALEVRGVGITVADADVADVESLRAAARRLPAGMPLRTVVHCAAAPRTATVGPLDAESWAATLAPKVAGTRALEALIVGQPLDAFVCFGSIAGVWGSGGQAAYAAANAFLEVWARSARARGIPATTVAFGPWAGDGMAAGETGVALEERGIRKLDPDVALRSIGAALQAGAPAPIVADVDWPRFRRSYEARGPRPLVSDLGMSPTIGDGPDDRAPAGQLRAELAAAAQERRGPLLQTWIAVEVARVLGLDSPLAPGSETFMDLGLDSLMAVEVRSRAQHELSLEPRIEVHELYDHATVETLAAHLLERLGMSTIPRRTEAA